MRFRSYLMLIAGLVLAALCAGQQAASSPAKKAGAACAGKAPQFEDITAKTGVTFQHISSPDKKFIVESMSGGVLLLDYDRDGWLDIYFTNAPTVDMALKSQKARGALYHNNHDGTFTDVTDKAGIATPCFAMGGTVGDYNNNGWPDIYVTCLGDNVLYRNNGDGTFTEISKQLEVNDPSGYYGMGVIWSDLDRRGEQDIYVADDSTPSYLYRNEGGKKFTDISMESGTAVNGEGAEQGGMGVTVGDYLHTGYPAIFKTNFDGEYNTLYRNEGHYNFKDVSYESGLAAVSVPYVGGGTSLSDFD